MTTPPPSALADGPLVSVIVPCWNAISSIEGALASVLAERSVRLECIVVDDGSTDRTAEAVERVAAIDARVVLVRLAANEGVSAARNRALDVSTGDWLTFLDADDRFSAGGLARLLRAAIDTDALTVVGQQIWSDGRHTWLSSFYDIPDIRQAGRKSLVTHPGLLYYVSAHGKLFHRSVVDDLRFKGRVLGDQQWVIRALLRAVDRIEVLDETVYEWRRSQADAPALSITAVTRSSASGASARPAALAEALGLVRQEAAAQIPDGANRERFLAAYVERLLSSDLGVHLGLAISRADPSLADLLSAVDRFLEAVPEDLLGDSRALPRWILEPPLRSWRHLPASSRDAYRSLLRTALAKAPHAPDHASSQLARLAIQRAATHAGPSAGLGLVLTVLRTSTRVPRRVGRLIGRR